MIPVAPQPEPPHFDSQVRRPGTAALARGERPLPPHWRLCLDDLHRAYSGICAYAAIFIPPVTGARSVDHFAPKSLSPELAYEWSNYRLTCTMMNARKREFQDVLDPFTILPDCFQLQMTTLEMFPGDWLPADLASSAKRTIFRLKLNAPDCLEARASYYDEYRAGTFGFDFLRRKSPFVAREVERQGLRRAADI